MNTSTSLRQTVYLGKLRSILSKIQSPSISDDFEPYLHAVDMDTVWFNLTRCKKDGSLLAYCGKRWPISSNLILCCHKAPAVMVVTGHIELGSDNRSIMKITDVEDFVNTI
jgi:hypothetical protein